MKKILVLVLALAMVLTTAIGVFASEEDSVDETVCNMDAESYETIRMGQIDDALANGEITLEQAEILRVHVLAVVAEGSFGKGPSNGNKGEGNAECVLGDNLNLGIFRSESAGMRTGAGNGFGQNSQDGIGFGNGQGNRGANRGAGNRYDGNCILD